MINLKNRLIVGGVDLSEKFGMILVDGYTLSTPKVKTYTIDIPSSNMTVDITEGVYGDVTYGLRSDKFTFYVIDPNSFEEIKTEIKNFLHGRYHSYEMTMDPGYTYRGRFTVTSTSHEVYSNAFAGKIDISISAEPYKYKQPKVYSVGAIGGRELILKSGRMRVRPVIEVNSLTTIIFKNKIARLTPGTHTVNDLLLESGDNDIYINTFNIRNLLYKDLNTDGVTWGDLSLKKIYEWYRSKGTGTYVPYTWEDVQNKKWNQFNSIRWSGLINMIDAAAGVSDVYIKYEWGDL